MSNAPLDYAGPQTVQRRRPLFVVPAKWARRAAVVSILLSLPALYFHHDHRIERSYHPRWRQLVTPIATAVALPLAGFALLRDKTRRRPAALAGGVALLLAGGSAVGMFALPRGIVDGESA